ncbi:plasmid transfer protein TraA [Streptomyces sp. NPDC098789]|uniref:plasmid transfer protein TraA n=1 Tax=Streptomyces sp. NPDC098789 TaxID=3366098 RepID=UPI003805AC31
MSDNTWVRGSGGTDWRTGAAPGAGTQRSTPQGGRWQEDQGGQQYGPFGPGPASGGTSRSRTSSRSREYHFHINDAGAQNGGGYGPQGGRGQQQGGGRGQAGGGRRMHSPLGDPEFFNNVDIRNYCEQGRGLFLQMSFELANAAEMLNAVLKEVPDPDGRPFGSRARARRVSRRMKKAAEDAVSTAKNLAATYASFQREFDPQLAPQARRRPTRSFDFNA